MHVVSQPSSLARSGQFSRMTVAPVMSAGSILAVRSPRFILGRRVHRIEQHINGRLYYIELSQVQRQRWRAHVVTAQGAPTALMPFYDDTADAAAQRLAEWLSRLHRPSEAHA